MILLVITIKDRDDDGPIGEDMSRCMALMPNIRELFNTFGQQCHAFKVLVSSEEEGKEYFSTFTEAFISLFILFTTANNPVPSSLFWMCVVINICVCECMLSLSLCVCVAWYVCVVHTCRELSERCGDKKSRRTETIEGEREGK